MTVCFVAAGKKKAAATHPLTPPLRARLNHKKYIEILKERDQDWLLALTGLKAPEAAPLSGLEFDILPVGDISSFHFDYSVDERAVSASSDKLQAVGTGTVDGQPFSF